MMRKHQFIHKNEQSKNRRRVILLLLLFSACNKGLGLAQVYLTGQMRCSHLVELSNSPLRTPPLKSGSCSKVFSHSEKILSSRRLRASSTRLSRECELTHVDHNRVLNSNQLTNKQQKRTTRKEWFFFVGRGSKI